MVQSWKNNDGLYRKFGTDVATSNNGGEYHRFGKLHEVELKLTLTGLTQTETIQNDVVVLPKGARIVAVDVLTETAAATGVAIDVGLMRTDRTTEVDYDGLLAALPTASMNAAGEHNIVEIGHTYVGALVGTTTVYPTHVSASATTSTAFTAGVIWITVKYYAV